MQVKTITVNKTAKNNDGIKIDVVVPQADTEVELLSYLLAGFIRDAHGAGRFKVDLPDQYQVTYQAEGSFLVTTESGVTTTKGSSPFYSPPKPVAVVAIQRFGKRFDLAYAAINQDAFKAQKEPAAENKDAAKAAKSAKK